MGEITEESYFKARDRLRKAEKFREEAQEAANMDYLSNEGDAITDCQRAIEHTAKSLFLLVDVPLPKHNIDPQQDKAEILIEAFRSEMPDRYPIEEIGRLLSFFAMIGALYPTSEQGIQTKRLNIESKDMFTLKDVQFLFYFADESVTIGKRALNYAAEVVF